jgi:hypothetical protein
MPATPGIYFDSLAGVDIAPTTAAQVAGSDGYVTAKVPLFFITGTATYNVFKVPTGAPYTAVVVGFGGILAVNGVGGMTIQLQTSAGVAITNAINLAAVAQYGMFSFGTLDYATGICGIESNLLVVTTGNPTGYCAVEIFKVNA